MVSRLKRWGLGAALYLNIGALHANAVAARVEREVNEGVRPRPGDRRPERQRAHLACHDRRECGGPLGEAAGVSHHVCIRPDYYAHGLWWPTLTLARLALEAANAGDAQSACFWKYSRSAAPGIKIRR